MKTYKQRTESILQKTNKKKQQRRAMIARIGGASVSVATAALTLVLFLPYSTEIPSVSEHQNSEYYSVIKKLNEITYEAPKYKNNYEKWAAVLGDMFKVGFGGAAVAPEAVAPEMDWDSVPDMNAQGGVQGGSPQAPEGDRDDMYEGEGAGSPSDSSGENDSTGIYEETTDNQVAGVIEGDLLKRTDKYAFYLTQKIYSEEEWHWNGEYYEQTLRMNGHLLSVYSIAGYDSQLKEEFMIVEEEGMKFSSAAEMYLSQDGQTITVFTECYNPENEKFTAVISLDVSDEPMTIREKGRIYLSGSYLSSRLVDGDFLVVNSYTLSDDIDFRDESTFLPQYGTLDNMQSVDGEDIVCSDIATAAKYTVVTKIDGKTLVVEDSEALLSYSEGVYVSATNLFLTQNYTFQNMLDNGTKEDVAMTEISCVSYAGEGLELTGTVSVEGSIKDQYSMDEYEGILRVSTTYRSMLRQEHVSGNRSWWSWLSSTTNANLYCIDLSDFEIVGKAEKFAPEGETVESVRFNGDKGYVCTAKVVTFTDPVFFFDLSDPEHLTWTDTGTIDGYSSSLVDFGHGYLVGIGYSEWGELKVEVYTQGEGKVEAVCSYTLSAEFSEDYKSYLIDRENGLIGIGVVDRREGYLLLVFKDGEFTKEDLIWHDGDPANKRAFYEDGYLYLFGGEFRAVALEI